MSKRTFMASLVSFVAMLAAAPQAKAAIVTEEFTVNASDFINVNTDDPVPYNTFTTTFDITFDPAISYDPTNTGFALKSASFGFDSNYYGFTYGPTLSPENGPLLSVGGVSGGSFFGSENHFDMELDLQTPTNGYVRYITADDSNFEASNVAVSVASVSAVPLPAALPLFGAAFAGLTSLRMRKARRIKPV